MVRLTNTMLNTFFFFSNVLYNSNYSRVGNRYWIIHILFIWVIRIVLNDKSKHLNYSKESTMNFSCQPWIWQAGLPLTYFPLLQVKTNFRTAITIPEKSWSRFRDVFGDYCDKMKEIGENKTTNSGEETPEPK